MLFRSRNVTAHLSAQKAGRDKIFDDYRVRVTSVIRDYGLRDREHAPHNVVIDGEHAKTAAAV